MPQSPPHGFLEAEDEPDSIAILDVLRERDALVPQLWHAEIRNALLSAERRGRITPSQTAERLGYLGSLLIHADQEPDFDAALALAKNHRLTLYDAT